MLGLFQTDIPIGRRLWLTFLILTILGNLDDIFPLTPNSNPVTFAVRVLMFFGCITTIDIAISLFINGIHSLVTLFQNQHQTLYQYSISQDAQSSKFNFLPNISFVAAVFLCLYIYEYYSLWIHLVGSIGLFLLIMQEIFGEEDFIQQTKHILKLEYSGHNCISITFVNHLETKPICISISSDWLSEIRLLLSVGWEIIEYNNSQDNLTAVLVRNVYVSRADSIIKSD